jgi:DNA repair protein RadC
MLHGTATDSEKRQTFRRREEFLSMGKRGIAEMSGNGGTTKPAKGTDARDCKGHRSRLRRKFLQFGFDALCEHEIIELILTLSIPRQDVKGLAKKLLRTFGSIGNIFDAKAEKLVAMDGIGETTATAFKIMRAANVLYLQKKLEGGQSFHSTVAAMEFWRCRLSGLEMEVVEVACLDAELRLIENGLERLETGTVSATTVYPRKIAQLAVSRRCNALIIAHNHPSGPACPSDQDARVTRRLQMALLPLDIVLVDHVIVSRTDAFSFRDNSLL